MPDNHPKLAFNPANLEQLPLVDILYSTKGKGVCTDDAEELTLTFPGGKELTIYYHSVDNRIVVEVD